MGKTIQTAPCRYCGQIVQFESGELLTDEQALEMAVLECSCEDAKAYRRWQLNEKRALENVQRLFGEKASAKDMAGEGVIAILDAAVCGICGGEIEKITLNLPGGVKAGISINTKGEVKVERTETKKRKLTG